MTEENKELRKVEFPYLNYHLYVPLSMPKEYEHYIVLAYMEGKTRGKRSVQDPIIYALGLSEIYKELD